MDVKTLPGVTVLYSSHQTTLKELNQFGNVMKELFAEAATKSIVSGPLYWIYHGVDGKPDTVFTLDIAVPIQGAVASSKFSVKQLLPFKAITHRHEGAWDNIPKSFDSIMQFVDSKKIPLRDEYREMYLNIDFQHPENNITEMQMGAF